MSRARFWLLAAGLACNLAALLLLAWLAWPKPTPAPRPGRLLGIQLGTRNQQDGISLQEWDQDGANEAAQVAGSDCRTTREPPGRRYLYFAIDPAFKNAELLDVLVTVEYFDHAPGEFRLNYDGVDPAINRPDPYRTAQPSQRCLGSQEWQTAHFVASGARFKNSQNGRADFRLELRVPEISVRRVTILRLNDLGPSTAR